MHWTCLRAPARNSPGALARALIANLSGHVLAFYNLGMMHAMGIGVMRNCQTSAELLKNVAERGTWGNELMDAHALYHKVLEVTIVSSFFK